MTGFAPKYFLFMFGLLFIAYYPIAIGMAIYVGGLYWFFSKENPLYGCIWAGGGCYISAFIVHNLIQLIAQKGSIVKNIFLCLLTFLVISTAFGQEIRTKNNGNLILEDIPSIPQSIKDDLVKFQNVRSASFRGFHNENEGLYISTRFGNVSQLHFVQEPGSARNQITYFQEPIGSVSVHPTNQSIIFTMDKGGTENAQIYLLDPSNASAKLLSDGESRNGGPLWSSDGSQIAFQSTKRNGRSNDIWIMNVNNPEENQVVLESPDGTWWGASDWTENSKMILVQNYISITNSKIYFCLLYTSPSPRDQLRSRMPSSA